MAQTTRQYDFQPGQKALSQQVDDELNNLVNAHNALDTDVQGHKTNTSNPHSTTASQVGAYSKTESDAKYETITNVDSKLATQKTDLAGAGRTTETIKGNTDSLNSHIGNTNNPHNVTYLQVGALAANDVRIHPPSQVGTKTVDEGLIGDGKVLMYDATLGKIKYQSVPGLSGSTVVADGTIQTNLNADMVDNRHVGSAAGNIPYLDGSGMIPSSMIPSVSKATLSDSLLTSTAQTTVLSYTPTSQGNFEAKIYYRVVTGTTNVTVQITYDDATGAQTNTVLNAQSSAIGSYSCLPVFINAKTTNPISIKITASVANQVYVSASIVGY